MAASGFPPDPLAPAGTIIGRLTRRADFLRAAKGRKWHGRAFTLQAIARSSATADQGMSPDVGITSPRVGFTMTRKLGGAVVRNRARRRLKEALRLAADLPLRGGHDYVVIGRNEALRLPFEALKSELARAFIGVHDAGRSKRGAGGPSPPRSERTGP